MKTEKQVTCGYVKRADVSVENWDDRPQIVGREGEGKEKDIGF